jgi:putative glutathione S-transferase
MCASDSPVVVDAQVTATVWSCDRPRDAATTAAKSAILRAMVGHVERGKWVAQEGFPSNKAGAYTRPPSVFRCSVTPDMIEAGRFHLYVSLACPWAHRTLIARALGGLESAVSLSVVHPFMGDDGWTFEPGPGVQADPIHAADYLWQVYVAADPEYTGRVTVPVLWDRERGTIACNESREVLRLFTTGFAHLGTPTVELCPPELREQIDAVIDRNYEPINNGVYRAGFARTQSAYDEAVTALFAALESWERILADQRFTCGDRLTEADICLFTTLVRFDSVYHGHFKCNLRRLDDMPNLWGFVRDVYQTPGVKPTVDFDHIKGHYYRSHAHINPTRIVPAGPVLDFDAPHGRG